MSKTDYNLTRIKAVVFDVDGVLSPCTIPVGEDGVPQRMANVRDGYAIKYAVEHGFRICIITGARSKGVTNRMAKLGVTDFFDNIPDKLPVLKKWMEENNFNRSEVAYVGDDIPDLECMGYVGLPITPADGSIDAKAAARYITIARGGHGVARELLEQILKAKGLWNI
ncbi:MAG: HAD hydrolase-like protein [Muribaculaceae bacterium]|nr:HAD hydrolase-like protein [Muribaculaceae bacterium]